MFILSLQKQNFNLRFSLRQDKTWNFSLNKITTQSNAQHSSDNSFYNRLSSNLRKHSSFEASKKPLNEKNLDKDEKFGKCLNEKSNFPTGPLECEIRITNDDLDKKMSSKKNERSRDVDESIILPECKIETKLKFSSVVSVKSSKNSILGQNVGRGLISRSIDVGWLDRCDVNLSAPEEKVQNSNSENDTDGSFAKKDVKENCRSHASMNETDTFLSDLSWDDIGKERVNGSFNEPNILKNEETGKRMKEEENRETGLTTAKVNAVAEEQTLIEFGDPDAKISQVVSLHNKEVDVVMPKKKRNVQDSGNKISKKPRVTASNGNRTSASHIERFVYCLRLHAKRG